MINHSTSNLYKRTNYTDKNINIISKKITEYDLEFAGYNISRYYNLLPENELNQLSKIPKGEAHVRIGLLQKYNKEYNLALSDGFVNARKLFFTSNKLRDEDILSIKKDAIFVISKSLKNLQFGNLNFRKKNTYTSYMYLNSNEFYFNSRTNIVHVKGIHDDTVAIHQNYFLGELKKVLRVIEMNDKTSIEKSILSLARKYKRGDLDINCYRELNSTSLFRYKSEFINSYSVGSDTSIPFEEIEIKYNFNAYIIPLLNLLI